MPEVNDRWYQRYSRASSHDATLRPTFTSFDASRDDGAQVAGELRRAFAFLRRHGDRRYSASSLMRLLTFADRLDGAAASGEQVSDVDRPKVIVAEVPFSFDEETEVKSGGVLAIAVVLPDGRMMLAVHEGKRRIKLGTAIYGFITNYVYPYPVAWVHQANTQGQMFLLSVELQPWQMNSGGALAFCARPPVPEESDAVAYCDDSDIEMQMARQGRAPGRARSTGRARFSTRDYVAPARAVPEGALTPDYAASIRYSPSPSARDLWAEPDETFYSEVTPERERRYELCDDPDCDQCARARREDRDIYEPLVPVTASGHDVEF